MLIDEGRLSPEDAARHPQKNVITRALGTDSMVSIDLYEYEVKSGDTFLVCTDGLYNMVPEEEIYSIVSENAPESAVKQLINLANENGGSDNITVMVFNSEGDAADDQ